MSIGGVSLILILGIVNFILILFQLGSGMHWIKAGPKIHRKTGIALLVCASLHALLAALVH